MTLKLHVNHDFLHLDADAQFSFGEAVVADITTNASSFPNLPHTVVVMGAANTLLHTTRLAYVANGESSKGDFINAEYDWKVKFTHTAVYVDFQANGSQAIIDKSGYKSTADTSSPNQHLVSPVDFKSHGNPQVGNGVVFSAVKELAGLRAYLFTLLNVGATMAVVGNQITISMGAVVVCSFIINNTAAVNFFGMTSLTKMEAQATGFNTAGLGDFSSAVAVSVP